jgi:hypothetical protein
MPFSLDSSYVVYTGGMVEGAKVCEQAGAYYLVVLGRAFSEADGPIPYTALGPYASVDDALSHTGDLPPPEVPPLPPPIPPPTEPAAMAAAEAPATEPPA